MTTPYHAFENLQQHKARLNGSVQLGSGVQLAAWSNGNDCITQRCDHHTLSLYVTEGYETYQKNELRLAQRRRPGSLLHYAGRQ
ncbi:Uncharacterised protein [Cedecea neteri]|uniref:AraC family transcriptional regulator n=1 Tax=Cedecea neteri TaxID=158822 RepID=A0A2X3J2Y0_9ENTR|nr:Uncharacterised protein [Cedecea neteri]